MPASHRALAVTDTYRRHLQAIRARSEHAAARHWQIVSGENLDVTHARWAQRTAPALATLQQGAARLSTAYVAAFATVELGRRVTPTGASIGAAVVGQSRSGKPLDQALDDSLPAVKSQIASGAAITAALAYGLNRVTRDANENVAYAARGALSDAMSASEDVIGYRRVSSGGCGACLALADGEIMPDDSDLEVHDNCQCTAEPVIAGAADNIQRPTGPEIFAALPADHQDQLLGPKAAQLVRDGQVPFHALIARSPMDAIPDQITQAPLEDLEQHASEHPAATAGATTT